VKAQLIVILSRLTPESRTALLCGLRQGLRSDREAARIEDRDASSPAGRDDGPNRVRLPQSDRFVILRMMTKDHRARSEPLLVMQHPDLEADRTHSSRL
jgi:hypothetical protein